MKKIFLTLLLPFLTLNINAQTPCLDIVIDTISEPYCPSDFGGALVATPLGGSGNYTYLWLDSLGNNPSGIPASSSMVSNLNLHTFWVYVTDVIQSCTDSASASFLSYSCIEDTASISVLSDFTENPVDYNVYSSTQLLITNNGCEVDLKPEFIISHDLPIVQGAITIEFFNSITSNWENINYSIVNGDAVGYWGDLDGENVGCGSSQSRPVRVLFNQFNPSANVGEYTASLRLWKVNGNGDLLDIISEETEVSIILQDTICNTFSFDLDIQDASCGDESDGQITINTTGGLPPVEYALNNLLYSSQNSFSSLQADATYIVNAKDNNNCQISDTIVLGPPVLDPDTLWFTSINPSNAIINWEFNNLVDGYKFRYRILNSPSWLGPVGSPGGYDDGMSNANTSKFISGLMGGMTYEVQVKTNSLIDNCEEGWSNSHFFETPNESFIFDIQNTCFQSQIGSISLDFNAQSSGYSFSWTDGGSYSSNDTSIFNLDSGDYQLIVMNPLSMVILDTSFTILENASQDINFYVNNDSSLVNNVGGNSFISICNPNSFLHTQEGLSNFNWSNGYAGDSLLLDTIENNSMLYLTATDQDGCLLTSNDLYLTIVSDFIDFKIANVDGDILSNSYSFCSSDSIISLDVSLYNSGEFAFNWFQVVGNNLVNIGSYDTIILSPEENTSYLLEIYNCSFQFNVNYLESIPTNFEISDNLCYGDSSGTLIINSVSNSNEVLFEITNSLFEIVYSELSNDFSDTIQNLPAGIYDVYVSDTTSMCPFNNEVVINEPDSLIIQAMNINSLSCFNDSVGSFMFNIIGGTPPYNFELDGESIVAIENSENGTFFIEGLMPSVYVLSVLDSNNCSDTFNINIIEPDSLSLSIIDYSENLSCNGDTTGFISLEVMGGVPSYNLQLFNEDIGLLSTQSNTLFQDLSADNYTIIVSDSNGCVDSAFVEIQEFEALSLQENVLQHQDISCFGFSDGQVSFDISGGLAPYYLTNFIDTLFQSPYTFDNLDSDTLSFLLTDSLGCNVEASSIVIDTDSIIFDTLVVNPIQCMEEFGSIEFLIVTNPTYTFELNGNNIEPEFQNDSVASIFNLPFNLYQLEVTDGSGCTDSLSFDIVGEVTTLALDTISYSDTLQCFGDSSGFINFATHGGVFPYSYNVLFNGDTIISDTSSLGNLTDLVAGEYFISVQDSMNCISNLTIEIFEMDQIIVSENLDYHQDVSCYGLNDGSFELLIEGGVSPYNVFEINSANNISGEPYIIDDLFAGLYEFEVTDDLGCATDFDVSITQPDSLILSLLGVNNISCIDTLSSINFEVDGGTLPYTYLLNNDTVNPELNLETNYMQITGFPQNNYDLVIQDANGCLDSNSLVINDFRINYNFNIVDYLDTIVCYGDSTAYIEVEASGGLEPYQFSLLFGGDTINSQQTSLFENLIAGDYQITVSDSNECTEMIEVSIYQNEELMISDSLEAHNDLLCVDSLGSFTLLVEGGVPNYQLNILNEPLFNYPHSFNNLEAGTYEVIVTDNVGCTSDIEIIIENSDTLLFDSFDIQDVLCFGDSNGVLNYNVLGGEEPYYYMIDSDSSKTLDAFSIGFYMIEIIDVNGCMIDSLFEVNQPQILTLEVDTNQSQNISCFNGEDGIITLSANGGVFPYQYLLDSASLQNQNVYDDLTAQSYNLTVIDGNDCEVETNYTLTQPIQSFTISNYTVSDTLGYCVLCYGDSTGTVDVEVSGGAFPYNYYLNGSLNAIPTNSTITNLVGGQDFEFYVVDSLGCFTDTVMLNCNSSEEISFEASNQIAPLCCYSCDGQASIDVTGGTSPFTYSHNGGNFQLSNFFDQTCNGLNQFEVIDNYGCQMQQSLTLASIDCVELDTINYMNINNSAVVNFDSCKTENTGHIFVKAVNGISPFQISFDYQDFVSADQMYYDQLSSGNHDIILLDNNLCLDTLTVNIAQADPLSLDSLLIDSLFCSFPSVNSITNLSGFGGFQAFISGGTPSLIGYKFSVDQIDSTNYSYNNSMSILESSIYSVNVLDDINCSFEFDFELNGFTSSANYNITNISCPGFDDGIIEIINLEGQVTPWLEFDNILINNTILTNISAGEHILSTHFQYPNDNSQICVNYDTIYFDETQEIEYDVFVDGINCNGDCNGIIEIDNVNGGTPPYSYLCLSNGQTTMVYEDLCAGNYAVRVADSLGCYETTQVFLSENSPIYPIITQVDGGLLVSEPTNDIPNSGTPPYSYQWYDESGILVGETSQLLSLDKLGTYYVEVTDSFNCKGISADFVVSSVDINFVDELQFNIFPNPVSDYLNLTYLNNDKISWTISDNLARILMKGDFVKSDKINVQSLNNGVYFICLKKDNKEVIFKIIKE